MKKLNPDVLKHYRNSRNQTTLKQLDIPMVFKCSTVFNKGQSLVQKDLTIGLYPSLGSSEVTTEHGAGEYRWC